MNPRVRQTGLSMIELMIAITLGLIVVAAVSTAFVNNSRARNEIEKTSRQIENGRYGMQVLMDDLQAAGFLAELDPTSFDTSALVALPDACATDLATLRSALPLHIQGYDNGAGAPTCLSDVKANTDILVVRRASTCVAGTTNCDAATGTLFQASLCAPATGGTELSATPTSNAPAAYNGSYYTLDTNSAALTLHKADCTTVADVRRYRTHIYFVANNDNSGDGIPTLKRAELGAGGFTIVPLVEGIDNLQLEYGVDTNNNGAPDVYTANPGANPACAGTACITNWRNVMTVKVNVLARNIDATTGYTDNKTYKLGQKADGTDNTFGPFNDAFKRHAYTGVVRLNNPAGRRE